MSAFLPCPVCSGVPQWFNRPTWFRAHRTTLKRGKKCDFIYGCRHVKQLFTDPLIEEPNHSVAIRRWNEEAERIFTEATAGLTVEERLSFRLRLFIGHKDHLPPPS